MCGVCEGVIIQTQSVEDRRLRVIGCLYCMSRRPRVWGYDFDSTGVNQLRLPGPVPEIEALLPALTRMGSRVLSLIGRRCRWDKRSECMSLSCCKAPFIRGRRLMYENPIEDKSMKELRRKGPG